MARSTEIRDKLALRSRLTASAHRRDGEEYWFPADLATASGLAKVSNGRAIDGVDPDNGGAGLMDRMHRALERKNFLGDPTKVLNTPDGLMVTALGAEPLLSLLEGEFRAVHVGEVRTYLEDRYTPLPEIVESASTPDTPSLDDVARLVAEETAALRGEVEALAELLADAGAPQPPPPVDMKQVREVIDSILSEKISGLGRKLWEQTEARVQATVAHQVDARFKSLWGAASDAVTKTFGPVVEEPEALDAPPEPISRGEAEPDSQPEEEEAPQSAAAKANSSADVAVPLPITIPPAVVPPIVVAPVTTAAKPVVAKPTVAKRATAKPAVSKPEVGTNAAPGTALLAPDELVERLPVAADAAEMRGAARRGPEAGRYIAMLLSDETLRVSVALIDAGQANYNTLSDVLHVSSATISRYVRRFRDRASDDAAVEGSADTAPAPAAVDPGAGKSGSSESPEADTAADDEDTAPKPMKLPSKQTRKARMREASKIIRGHRLTGMDRAVAETLAQYGDPGLPQQYIPHHLKRDRKDMRNAGVAQTADSLRRLAKDGIVVETSPRHWALKEFLHLAA